MATQHVLATLSSEITQLVDSASSHVVSVAARPRRPASGLALGGDLIVTADHAVERDADIGVSIGETKYQATLVGRDSASDVALLRAPGLAAPAPESAPVPGVGALVVSLARTTSGTVSAALGVITSVGGPLRTPHGVVLPRIIRTDAALRPGTAGGVIVDVGGRVIGMTTPALLRGLPVAIPIEQVREIAGRLASSGSVGRAYLGVSVHPVRLPSRQRVGDAGERGLLISGIAADSAAEQAGLLVGDVLVRFNDRPLGDVEDLQDLLASAQPGGVVPLAVLRGGSMHQTELTIGARS